MSALPQQIELATVGSTRWSSSVAVRAVSSMR
jgi:hypothetical protein